MRTKVKRVSDGFALVLDETLVDRFGVDETSEMEVSMQDDGFFVKPLSSDERQQRFREAAEKIADKHAGLFKRLAE